MNNRLLIFSTTINTGSVKRSVFVLFFIIVGILNSRAEDGYELWLRYKPVDNQIILNKYKNQLSEICIKGNSATFEAIKTELTTATLRLLGESPKFVSQTNKNSLILGTSAQLKDILSAEMDSKVKTLHEDGFVIFSTSDKKSIVITSKTEIGVLYGMFHFLRILQTHQSIDNLNIISEPKIKHRLLNHWDGLNRFVERGYAGCSIWDWHRLPEYRPRRYTDYARANASVGINGVVLNNVNADPQIIDSMYIEKAGALAEIFRPYGIKVYLSIKFNSPMLVGGMKTADPLDENVIEWWKDKTKEIYKFIPDFGGFLVKANSEGQPGPQNFGRSHAEGANMLARALKPYNGIVMWRAFVYDNNTPTDRAKQAYNEFTPLDGQFDDNVIIQVKNGPIDFQPREPIHPLFGAMPKTSLMLELQITQEYLGFATHLVYLSPLYKECLDTDTYAKGKGSTVAKVIDGSLFDYAHSGIAGVANIGNERNWTGHIFGQANWYAFGRLAWDHTLSSEIIANEWLKMTFSNQSEFLKPMSALMLESRENTVNYMTPLGLHHIMGNNHHFGPGPWVNTGRADWTSVYYHRADSLGIGFDRSSKGSKAAQQYFEPLANQYDDLNTCPEKYLLWFHHVSWDYKLKSGNTLWDEICIRYYQGTERVVAMKLKWMEMNQYVDDERFSEVEQLLKIQIKEAELWRDACVLYFQTFSKRPVPNGFTSPKTSLDYLKKLKFEYAPGI